MLSEEWLEDMLYVKQRRGTWGSEYAVECIDLGLGPSAVRQARVRGLYSMVVLASGNGPTSSRLFRWSLLTACLGEVLDMNFALRAIKIPVVGVSISL